MKEEFFYLGTLTKPFGLKGDLCAFFDSDNPENYLNLIAVFLDIEGEKIPYTIENLAYRGNNRFVIKFHDIHPDEASEFAGVELYLPLSDLPKLSGNQFYFHEVIGFTVVDELLGEIGVCKGFLEVSHNPIMQVDHEGKEILVPASQHFIRQVDRENRILRIQAPDGLIEVYL